MHGQCMHMRLFSLLLLAAASPARSVHLSLGRGVLTGPASSDASHALSSVRALGVKQVLLLHCAPADESHLAAGRVDALVSQPGVGLQAQLRELRDDFGCDGWFHLATTVEECSYAKQLGAKVILLDEAAAADDALETLGFVAMAIIDDFAESVCASLGELPEAFEQASKNARASSKERTRIIDAFSTETRRVAWKPEQVAWEESALDSGENDAPYSAAAQGGATSNPATRPISSGSADRTKKYCFECGTLLPRTAKFCIECGERQPFVSGMSNET